jgi:hypothetical protein
MAVDLRQSKRFDAPSPVTRYWLANCVGFSLAGGGRGKVERMLTDVDRYDPSLLEVRTGRWRVRQMPVEAVVAVIPADRVLVVDRRLALIPDRRRDVTLRLRWTTRILWRGLGVAMTFLGALTVEAWRLSRRVVVALMALTAEAWRLSRRAWAAGSPAVARTSRRSGAEAVRLGSEATRLVRSVPWQSYGRSARSATTRLSHARSIRSSHRHPTSSGRRSAGNPSDKARTSSKRLGIRDRCKMSKTQLKSAVGRHHR